MKVLVKGRWLEIPEEWWDALEGPKPPPGFPNDGCTVVFDEIFGVWLWPACVIHDWHYSEGCTEITSRLVADLIFLHNTYTILRLQDVGFFRSVFHAVVRYRGVRRLGGGHFRSGNEG